MSRLIDADEALEKVHNQGIAHPSAYHLTNYATLILQEAPTVDATPVIRCQECKYSDVYQYSGNWYCTNDNGYGFPNQKPDDFCSRGERKNNELS